MPFRWMTNFAVHFDFVKSPRVGDAPRFDLKAVTLAEAKLEAALLYAVGDFGSPPEAYSILQGGEQEVYRYPEDAFDPSDEDARPSSS